MSGPMTPRRRPSPPGVDPELVEAFAVDVATLADSAEGKGDQLRGLVASIGQQASTARATPGEP